MRRADRERFGLRRKETFTRDLDFTLHPTVPLTNEESWEAELHVLRSRLVRLGCLLWLEALRPCVGEPLLVPLDTNMSCESLSSKKHFTTNNSLLPTCPLHTYSGCGKYRRTLIGPWWPEKWQHPLLELP